MKKLKFETKVMIAAVAIPVVVTLLALAPFPQGIKIIGDLVFQERSAVATTPVAGSGTFYVKNTTPSTPVFVDDTGTEVTLGAAGSGGVSGPGTSTDRAIPTYNGTGGATLRDSTVGIDASGNVTLASGDTVDGRELSTDGAKLDTVASNATANPAYDEEAGAGAGSAYIDVDGNLGLGTTTPIEDIDVYNTVDGDAPRLSLRYYVPAGGNTTVYPATWTGTTPGTSPTWVNPGNAAADDATDAFIGKIGAGSADGQTLKGTCSTPFAIDSGATIAGVKVEVEGYMYNLVSELHAYLVRGGTIDTGVDRSTAATWGGTMSVITYGGSTDDWGGITPAEINSTGFGFAFQPTFTGIGHIYIDYIRITVYYSTATGDYTWTSGVDISDGAWTIRADATDQLRIDYSTGESVFTGVVDADGYKQDGVLYDLSTFSSGAGDFVGPGSSTDNAILRFDGTTGKLGQNSEVRVDDTGNILMKDTGDTVDGRDVSVDGTKLDGIESGATADQSNSEIETAYNAQVAVVSQATAEAGTSTTVVRWTPERVKQAIDALAAGGGDVVGPASSVEVQVPTFSGTTGKLLQASPVYISAIGDMTGVGDINGLSFSPSSGNFVMETNTQKLENKRVKKRIGTTTSSGTPTINTDSYDIYSLTAQAAAITSFSSGLSGTPVTGDRIEIWITDNGTARAITWNTSPTSFSSGPATLPTTTILGKTLFTLFEYDGSIWVCMATGSKA